MNETQIQAMIAELENQRNAANTALVYKAAELAEARKKISELKNQIEMMTQENDDGRAD